jgi:hypothetical protein
MEAAAASTTPIPTPHKSVQTLLKSSALIRPVTAQVILTNAFYPMYHNHSSTDLDVVLAKVNHRRAWET